MCFGSLSCRNTHPRPIFKALAGFNALALTVHGHVHRPFDAVQLSCPINRKTPPKHNVSTSMFDGGDGVLGVIGSIPPPPNTASWVDAKKLDFGLIWPQHFHPVLLWMVSMDPAALRSLIISSRVVLGWCLVSPPARGIQKNYIFTNVFISF